MNLEWVAPFVAHPSHGNSISDTDTHPLSYGRRNIGCMDKKEHPTIQFIATIWHVSGVNISGNARQYNFSHIFGELLCVS